MRSWMSPTYRWLRVTEGDDGVRRYSVSHSIALAMSEVGPGSRERRDFIVQELNAGRLTLSEDDPEDADPPIDEAVEGNCGLVDSELEHLRKELSIARNGHAAAVQEAGAMRCASSALRHQRDDAWRRLAQIRQFMDD